MTEKELDEINNSFNLYMKEYKKQDLETKRSELINAIKELIASIDSLGKMDNIELHYLTNSEILDLKYPPVSEDDFLEASLAYIETAKCLIGEYLIYKEH